MHTYTMADIERLALQNPVIHACLIAQRYTPGITQQQMLLAMIVMLAENNAALRAQLIDLHAKADPLIEIIGK